MARDSEPAFDLFISYADVDNVPMFGAKHGWVSTLVQDLRNLLAQKMGRADAFSIWWDQINLRGNHEITQEIRSNLQRSATLLLVLSPGYLASGWCLQEKDLFFKVVGGKPEGRVFVVEMQVLDEDESVPDELTDIKGYRFWYKDERNRPHTLSIRAPEPHATEYTWMVEDLAHDIRRRLKALAASPPVPFEFKATIFLAKVTDDLEHRREQVRRYLEQAQLRVLPSGRYPEGQAFRDAIENQLAQSELFVQLLGPHPNRSPPEIPQGYTRLQMELAQQLELPVLQWRDPALKMDQVESIEQRELLEAVTVYAETLESFKQRVVRQAIPPEAPEPPKPSKIPPVHPGAPVVFINFEQRDHSLAETISNHVDKRLTVVLPVGQGSAREVREDLEQKLLGCDALMLVYGEGTLAWVDKQLLHCNRIAPSRDRFFRALGVYDGPPEDKPTVSTRMPGLEILPCRQGLDEQRLRTFLAPLLQSA